MSVANDTLLQVDKHIHVLSSKEFTQQGIFQLGEHLNGQVFSFF